MIAVRQATSEDYHNVAQLMVAFHAESGMSLSARRSRSALLRLLKDRSLGVAYVASSDHEIVGYLLMTLGFSIEYYGRDAFIDELYVREVDRRRGIATRMMLHVFRKCRSIRVKAVHLEVERDNRLARQLYRKLGFADHDRFLMTRACSTAS